MPRRFFSRFSRRFDPKKKQLWYLRPFEFLLTHPVYFSANRRSVSGGVALGLFFGLLPIPGQTALAIIGALLLRVNLPLAALSVWVSNPLTFLPLFYFAYRIGAILVGIPVEPVPPEGALAWLTHEIRPLIYGSLLMATSAASIAYLTISTVWHVLTLRRYRSRHKKLSAAN